MTMPLAVVDGNRISRNSHENEETAIDDNETNLEASKGKRIARAMALEDVRTSAKKLKSDFLGQMDSRLSAMMDDVMDSLQKTEYPERILMMSDPTMMKDKRKARVAGKLPEKLFRNRPSPLTELLEVPHFKTIYHIFIAALVLIMLQTVVADLLESKTVDLGFERLIWLFGNPLATFGILLGLEFFGLFIVYPSFYLWSHRRLHYKPETRKIIDYGAAVGFSSLLITFVYIPALTLLKNPLRPASGALVTMEQTSDHQFLTSNARIIRSFLSPERAHCRLLMKMYAFVRSNVPRALNFQKESNSNERLQFSLSEKEPKTLHNKSIGDGEDENKNENEESASVLLRKRMNGTSLSTNGASEELHGMANTVLPTQRLLKKQDSWISWDDENTPCPSYSKFLYFYFAPTLIYKDYYPRTTKVRWDYVFWNFAQVFGCIIYANAVVGKYCSVYFSNFGLPDHPMTLPMLCNAVFSIMLPGILGLILGFFLLLHAWQNAFAEMLCFGDRLFYKDWWNRSSFADYYKTWNCLVHDWLYTYVFKDALESGFGQRYKSLPTSLVFLISSIFHEYILSFSLNFCLPVLLVLFGGFGFALVFIKNVHGPLGNIFMWMSLMAGTGIVLSAYSMEYFARLNCPLILENSAWDFVIPRSLSCGAIQWNK